MSVKYQKVKKAIESNQVRTLQTLDDESVLHCKTESKEFEDFGENISGKKIFRR